MHCVPERCLCLVKLSVRTSATADESGEVLAHSTGGEIALNDVEGGVGLDVQACNICSQLVHCFGIFIFLSKL